MRRTGPCVFTDTAVRRTIHNLPPVFALIAEGGDASLIEHHRRAPVSRVHATCSNPAR